MNIDFTKGKYGIDKKYAPGTKVSIGALWDELAEEIGDDDLRSKEDIRSKFNNSDRSGLIDKLKDNLDFDIRALSKGSDKEAFDMLKLLKVLFYLEKNGIPKCRKTISDAPVRIPITDILTKPRLENIQTVFTEKSVYGEVFSALFDAVKSCVDDAENRINRFSVVNSQWENLVVKIFDYVITDKALDNPADALAELDRIGQFLNKKVLKKLQKKNSSFSEGVMPTFFNLLLCHLILCDDIDRINIYYQLCLSEPPDSDYTGFFRKSESICASWDFLQTLMDELNGKGNDDGTKWVLSLITYGNQIDAENISSYKYAINNSKKFSLWLGEQTKNDFSEQVDLGILCSVIQEIYSTKENKNQIENDYLGYTNRYKSLKTAISNPGQADAAVMQAWITKIENRLAVNFGAYDLIKKKREIDSTIFEIKKRIFEYRNLDDLEYVNDIVYHFASRCIVSREYAKNIGAQFAEKIQDKLIGRASLITYFELPGKAINVLDMFREFTLDTSGAINSVASEIAEQINEFYEYEEEVSARRMLCEFQVVCEDKSVRKFRLFYLVDKRQHRFYYVNFFEVRNDTRKLELLGLAKFVMG